MVDFKPIDTININSPNRCFFEPGNRKIHNIDHQGIATLLKLGFIEECWAANVDAEVKDRDENPIINNGDYFQRFIELQNAWGTKLPTFWGQHYISFNSKRHFFRGEPKIYQHTLPSLIRKIYGKSKHEQDMWKALSDLRIVQFYKFICQFDFTRQWLSVCDINIKALAQHYGFDTCLLDLTNDVRIALFFATCKYIPEKDAYEPLNEKDIYSSPESRYGVIYHSPDWRIDAINGGGVGRFIGDGSKLFKPHIWLDNGDCDGVAFQIGLQPFRRCDYQSGYIFPMRYSVPLQEDFAFEIMHFEQSPKLSRFIFEMMEGGEKVFPSEGICLAKSEIESIKGSFIFSESDIRYVYEMENIDKLKYPNIESFEQALLAFDYDGKKITISSEEISYPVDSETLKIINDMYKDNDIHRFIAEGRIHEFVTYRD